MNRSDFRLMNRSRLVALVLLTGGALGLVAACSSDGGNSVPSGPPPITTGGGGAVGEAGENTGGAPTNAGATNHAGATNGGGSKGGSAPDSEGGEGGEVGGDAGAGPVSPTCPTTDQEFLNAPSPSSVQKSNFDNVKRLGAHATLPPLPT